MLYIFIVWFVKLKQSLKPIAKLVQMAKFCAPVPLLRKHLNSFRLFNDILSGGAA